jgi:hypothetical protein
MPTIKRVAATLAAATAFCVAPTASADPGVLMPTGYANGSEYFTTNKGSFNAGGFAGTWNGQGIEFWCIELTQYFSFGGTYGYVAIPENTPVLTALGQLFTLAHASALLDADHSAAFQLAIWELVYDGSNHSLSSGAFIVSGGDADARSIAQGWLSSLGPNSPDTWNLTLLTSAQHQDFVTFGKTFQRTVPEPAPLALLATAMMAMIVVRRRREHRIGA